MKNITALLNVNREEYRAARRQMQEFHRTLKTVYSDTRSGRPEDTVSALVEAIGYENAIVTIAETVNSVGTWDGRIYQSVRAWAAEVENAADADEMQGLHMWTDIHSCHVNDIARAAMKFTPEPEVNAGQVEAVTERLNALVSVFTWTKRQRAAVSQLVNKACTGAADIETAWNRLNDALVINYGVDLAALQAYADERAALPKKKRDRRGYASDKIIEKYISAYHEALQAVRDGRETQVRVSFENSKMGPVASVSLIPLLTCPGACMRTCGIDCYASKLANLRPAVLWSYAVNTALLELKPASFWEQVNAAVSAVRFFRFNVSGDIRNAETFRHMVECAVNHQHTDILIFTKKYRIVNEYVESHGGSRDAAIPENMKLLFSAWYGLDPINPYHFPETMVYRTEDEISDSWKLCGGNCFQCACRGVGCWQACSGDTIAFKKH